MAYMDQEKKAKLAPKIKSICQAYKVKASLAVSNYSGLVLNIKSSPLDFIGNYNATIAERDPTGNQNINPAKDHLDVNPYWAHEHYTGQCKEFLVKVLAAMNIGNHDRSDIGSDYFDIGWYVYIHVGQWNKPYTHTA